MFSQLYSTNFNFIACLCYIMIDNVSISGKINIIQFQSVFMY